MEAKKLVSFVLMMAKIRGFSKIHILLDAIKVLIAIKWEEE